MDLGPGIGDLDVGVKYLGMATEDPAMGNKVSISASVDSSQSASDLGAKAKYTGHCHQGPVHRGLWPILKGPRPSLCEPGLGHQGIDPSLNGLGPRNSGT